MDSEALGMKIAYRQRNGETEVMTEDRVRYNNKELKILNSCGGVTLPIHVVKKCFSGEVWNVGRD